ncbi:MAG: MFS transporter [Pseudomonadota bacterium]
MMPTRSIIFAGLLVFAMGQTILFALLGPVARDMGLQEWQVGAIISASAVVFVIVSPFWGRLVDVWGRKAVIVAGLAGYAAATLLFAAILEAGLRGLFGGTLIFAALVGSRLLYALASGGIQPAGVALMADLTDESGRSAGMAMVGAAFGLGSVLGPAVAAALVLFGVLVPLILAAALAIVLAIAVTAFVENPPRRSASVATIPDAKASLPAIAPFLLLALLTFIAISALQQTAAFYIQDFTGSGTAEAAQQAGYAFMALAAAMLVVQGLAVQVWKPSPDLMLGAGFPIAAFGTLVYLVAPSLPLIILGFALMGTGFGLVQPGLVSIVSLRASAETQGAAAGYVQSAMAGGFVVGPLAGTAIYALSPSAPLLLALACVLLAFLGFLAIVRRQRLQAIPRTPAQ